MGAKWVTVDYKEAGEGQGGYAKESSDAFKKVQQANPTLGGRGEGPKDLTTQSTSRWNLGIRLLREWFPARGQKEWLLALPLEPASMACALCNLRSATCGLETAETCTARTAHRMSRRPSKKCFRSATLSSAPPPSLAGPRARARVGRCGAPQCWTFLIRGRLAYDFPWKGEPGQGMARDQPAVAQLVRLWGRVGGIFGPPSILEGFRAMRRVFPFRVPPCGALSSDIHSLPCSNLPKLRTCAKPQILNI